MAITLDGKDLKPILQAVTGQEPKPEPAPAPVVPMVPQGPPPPTPAQAGYAAYASDPQNAAKIANSIVKPGQPVIPPSAGTAALTAGQIATHSPADPSMPPPVSMPGPVPNVGTPPPPVVQPEPMQNYDAWAAAHPDQIAKPTFQHDKGSGFKGYLRDAANIGVAGLVGAGGGLRGDASAGVNYVAQRYAQDQAVPGINQQRYQAAVVQPAKDAAAIENTRSQAAQRSALGNKADAQADSMAPQTITREQALAINQPELAGTQMNARDYAKLVGMAGNNTTSRANNQNTNDTRKAVADQAAALRKALTDSTNHTRELIAGRHDATSRANNAANNARSEANNANTVSHKGTMAGANGQTFKVPADVTKRAALASNVLENAQEVENIIGKRPDIVGGISGRYSNVQQMIGSDDPDIQALGVRMHNMALASNGAHGVRAQQAIQKTEDELFSNFHAGPHAIKGALDATRGSMQTFLNDEQNFSTTGRRTGEPPPKPIGGSTPPPSSDLITVQIPGQPPGQIHASQKAAFLAKYPNGKVVQ